MSSEKTPVGEMFAKYVRTWRAAWAQRHEMEAPKRDKDASQFLPAHLELIETPVSAAPRWVARLVMLFALLTLIWAYFGQLDIVAVTQGKTIISGHSKVIQPLENAVVQQVNVENGQSVKQGDVLVILSAIGAQADYDSAKQALQTEQLKRLRQQLFLTALEKRQFEAPVAIEENSGLTPAQQQEAKNLAFNHFQTWFNEDEALAATLNQRQAEKDTLQSEIKGLKELVAIENQRLSDLKKLYEKEYVSKHAYLEQKRNTLEINREITTKKKRLNELEAAISHVIKSRALKHQTLKSEALELRQQADEKINALQFSIHKTQQRQQLMTVTSPVDGTVQQLAIHTVGGVVTAAQAMMVIVPDSTKLQAEVMVANKDIGFVHTGQEAVVKIESFPYTRYGYVTGTVKSVTFDAIEHEQLGLVFSAIITLDKTQLNINGKPVQLTAGMNVTAEIKTGKRRVIDYILSPLKTKIDESFIER